MPNSSDIVALQGHKGTEWGIKEMCWKFAAAITANETVRSDDAQGLALEDLGDEEGLYEGALVFV